ncbi:hypothetical protein DFH06DRAFT_1125307 [Mycena polygramma]|nr:hypothetical protein DFH06DRAFT_1125307 [Mycena polygramma]
MQWAWLDNSSDYGDNEDFDSLLQRLAPMSVPLLSPRTPSPPPQLPDDYADDADFADLLERFAPPALRGPPHTPSQPPAYSALPTTPDLPQQRLAHVVSPTTPTSNHTRYRTPTTPTLNPTVYHVESPTLRGYTTEWSVAGSATQGVPRSQVHAIRSPKKKINKPRPAAYVVFCGKECGVKYTWEETKPLVHRVSCSIYRGYGTVPDANTAYEYAEARCWTRVSDSSIVRPIPVLPQPSDLAVFNPLHGTEVIDDRRYVVYRGVCPGIYRSLLESQLNTLGVPGQLQESVLGEDLANTNFNAALARGDVRAVPPMYREDPSSSDPFV